MSNKNEVFECLIDQLRQQEINNQCEDMAHEVQSLKNQLRDASSLVAELQEDNIKKSEHISHLTGQVKELHMALAQATGDAEAYKLIRKGEHAPGAKSDVYMYFGATEQCGCNGDDAQPSIPTGWVRWRGGACPVPDTIAVDVMFRDSQIIEHITPSSVLWEHHGALHGREIIAYLAPSNCEHAFVPDEYGLESICLRCGAKE